MFKWLCLTRLLSGFFYESRTILSMIIIDKALLKFPKILWISKLKPDRIKTKEIMSNFPMMQDYKQFLYLQRVCIFVFSLDNGLFLHSSWSASRRKNIEICMYNEIKNIVKGQSNSISNSNICIIRMLHRSLKWIEDCFFNKNLMQGWINL